MAQNKESVAFEWPYEVEVSYGLENIPHPRVLAGMRLAQDRIPWRRRATEAAPGTSAERRRAGVSGRGGQHTADGRGQHELPLDVQLPLGRPAAA